MNLDNLNFTTIDKSTMTVSYPFQYDREKVLSLDPDSIVKLNLDYLTDFLPYTKNNFFGKYHLEDEELTQVTLPCIMKNCSIINIEFCKDK